MKATSRLGPVVALLIGLAVSSTPAASAESADAASGAVAAPLLGLGAPNVVVDQYIVVMKSDAQAHQVRALSDIATTAGGTVKHTYATALRGFSALLPERALAAVRASDAVSFVEADQTFRVPADRVGRAASHQDGAPWHLDRIDQHALPLNDNYRYSATGAGVTAYVIDTGVRASHEDFTGRVLEGFTTVDDGHGTDDCYGHGTHVAGILGGAEFGVAKEVAVVPVRVFDCAGYATWEETIAAVDWVSANAIRPAVVNMSLGGGPKRSMDLAVEESIRSGISYVIAAGNGSEDACNTSPARVTAAVTVGGSNKRDSNLSYSNFGPCLDIWAPSHAVNSAFIRNDTDTKRMSGTSMAAPHAAGVMALYLETEPDLSPDALRDELVRNSSRNQLTLPVAGPNRLVFSR